jgi:hypothetical protein
VTTALNAFDSIKESLSIVDVTAFYGTEVKRGNKALCPLHNEKTPSFTVYPNSNSWHCFGCGAGGSAIDFVMAFFGLDPLEAAKKLDSDFSLGLFDHKPTQEELHRLKEQQAQHQVNKGLESAFKGFIDKAFNLLCDYLHLLNDWKTAYAPKTESELDKVNPLFVEACHRLDYTEYLLDSLLNADIDEQISFYNTHREEMCNLANRVKQHTNGE